MTNQSRLEKENAELRARLDSERLEHRKQKEACIAEADRLLVLGGADLYTQSETITELRGEVEALRGLVKEAIDTEDAECHIEWNCEPPCPCEWCKVARNILSTTPQPEQRSEEIEDAKVGEAFEKWWADQNIDAEYYELSKTIYLAATAAERERVVGILREEADRLNSRSGEKEEAMAHDYVRSVAFDIMADHIEKGEPRWLRGGL